MNSSILLNLLLSNVVVLLFSIIVAGICAEIYDESKNEVYDRITDMATKALIVSFFALPVLAILLIWLP